MPDNNKKKPSTQPPHPKANKSATPEEKGSQEPKQAQAANSAWHKLQRRIEDWFPN